VHLNSVTRKVPADHIGQFMSFMKLFTACLFILASILIGASIAQSATVGVEIRDPYYFTPTNVVINPGDRVVWTNLGVRAHDTRHSATPALWASPSLGTNSTFGFTFTNLGYYPYRCNQHILQGPLQTGSVSVVNISLASPIKTPTNIQFQIRGGRVGLKAVVDVAGSLGSWGPIATNNFPASGTVNFTNTTAAPGTLFYRARAIP
jgi:plastocyanin